jgi:chromosome segregation ATPase
MAAALPANLLALRQTVVDLTGQVQGSIDFKADMIQRLQRIRAAIALIPNGAAQIRALTDQNAILLDQVRVITNDIRRITDERNGIRGERDALQQQIVNILAEIDRINQQITVQVQRLQADAAPGNIQGELQGVQDAINAFGPRGGPPIVAHIGGKRKTKGGYIAIYKKYKSLKGNRSKRDSSSTRGSSTRNYRSR